MAGIDAGFVAGGAVSGVDKKVSANVVGNAAVSTSLYSDVVHEGTHASDFIAGVPEREIRTCPVEIRAYSAERQFQINSGMPVDFASEDDMLVHIYNNYDRE